jgi:hypothetical protein
MRSPHAPKDPLAHGCRPWAASSNAGLRDYILSIVGHFPLATSAIRARLAEEFGTVHKRAVYFALAGLTAQGYLVRSTASGGRFFYRHPRKNEPAPTPPVDRRANLAKARRGPLPRARASANGSRS